MIGYVASMRIIAFGSVIVCSLALLAVYVAGRGSDGLFGIAWFFLTVWALVGASEVKERR